jgi:DNA polymerase III alpha subunit
MVDWEGEYCGLYISAHPIDFIKIPPTIELDYINNLLPQVSQSGRCLVVITTIEDIQIKRGKMKGRSLYACTVEDKTGVAELTLFPNAVDEYKDRIKIGSIIYFKYSVDERSAVLRLKQNGVIKFING